MNVSGGDIHGDFEGKEIAPVARFPRLRSRSPQAMHVSGGDMQGKKAMRAMLEWRGSSLEYFRSRKVGVDVIIDILIFDYLASVEKLLSLFEAKIGRRDLVRAWREKVIPQTGEIAEDVRYMMHGVGCIVEFADYDVNFDFVTATEPGFDAWRLWSFAKQFPDRYPGYQNQAMVESGLNELAAAGQILRPLNNLAGETNGRLFRWVRH